MKTITLLLTTILLSLNILAQVPDKISFQAIIRDTNGDLVRNQQVRMKISILLNSDTGTPVYMEIHDPVSNENGLVSLEIGNGRTTDVFTAIDWSTGIYFLKTETDPEGNSNFTISGTSQILSVPYAFHAKTVENDQVDDADADPNNEIQTLSLNGSDLTLSDGGGTIAIPSSADNWGTQTVSTDATLLGKGTGADPLKVAHTAIQPGWANIQNMPGGFADNTDDVDDADADPTNELQTLSVSGNDLTISDGNTVALPEGTATPWQTSGNDIFFNSGNVGIGNSNPEQKLQIDGDLKVNGRVRFKDGTNGILVGASQGAMQIRFTNATGSFSNTNYFYGRTVFNGNLIAGNGKVGIGTETPPHNLTITSTDNESQLCIQNKSTGNSAYDGFLIGMGNPISANACYVWNYENGGLGFGANNKLRMQINANGNTVIGDVTANPEGEELLNIVGENPRILIEATSSNPEINFKSAGDADFDIWSIYKNSSSGDLHFYQNGNKLTIQKNTGYVGIGTPTPQGRLDVNGAIYQRGGMLHADYVFEGDYQLESIEEHAEFMWQNKHLPAIPKATKDDNGEEIVEVGSHRKGIVEELEKAHIYISQLEQSIKELTLRLEKLENATND